jgi:four helix bundle protein
MEFAESYRDLVVHKKARMLAKDIYQFTISLPANEEYSLKDQIRRSSRSIGAQIAEAWAKRKYEKHFVSKLSDADAEQTETQHWMDIALDCRYLTPHDYQAFIERLEEINRLLHGMMNKAHLFCNPSRMIREERAVYYCSPTT